MMTPRAHGSRLAAHAAMCIGAAVLGTLLLDGCSRQRAKSGDEAIQLGAYRATLKLPGDELPFALEIAKENEQYVAYLVNGAERVRVPEVTVADGHIAMRMPGLENTLSARIDDDELKGSVTLIKRDGKSHVIDFAAKRLPQLNGIYAFPTTLFLDRKGRVRRIYTGFSGPATGNHYPKLIEDFDSTVEQLLAETDATGGDTQTAGT